MAGAGSEFLTLGAVIQRVALRLFFVSLLLCFGALIVGGQTPTLQFVVHDSTYELWLVDGGRGMRVNLTNTPGDVAFETEPAWSHDGNRLAYTRSEPPSSQRQVQESGSAICIRDFGGWTTCLPRLSYWDRLPRWSPDDSRIAFLTVEATLAVAPADGSAAGRVILDDYYIVDYEWLVDGQGFDFIGSRLGEFQRNRYHFDLTTATITQTAADVRVLISAEARFNRYDVRP